MRFAATAALAVGVFLFVGQAPAVERPGYVTVLHYEWFDDPWSNGGDTSARAFREQMAYLGRAGYDVMPVEALRVLLSEKDSLPSKTVLITIDGSALGIYEALYPVLKDLGYPFLLFPSVKALDSGVEGLLSWEMVREMHHNGVTIGNLSYSNDHLGLPRRYETRVGYRTRVREEILNAERALSLQGMKTDLLAFPHGEYNPDLIEVAAEQGYRLMFTSDRGSLDRRTPLTRIPRMTVRSGQAMERFTFDLGLSPLHVADVTPDIGFLPRNPPPRLTVRLLDPGRYHPGVVNMFLTERDRLAAEFDSRTGVITFVPDRPFTQEANRITVSAKDRVTGQFSLYSYLVFLPFPILSGRPPTAN